ncbi:MAG: hypothetical protein IIX54_00545 [Clostridia bacterium]|nr:hypothetical protein [Clostridia bacterium]
MWNYYADEFGNDWTLAEYETCSIGQPDYGYIECGFDIDAPSLAEYECGVDYDITDM